MGIRQTDIFTTTFLHLQLEWEYDKLNAQAKDLTNTVQQVVHACMCSKDVINTVQQVVHACMCSNDVTNTV